MYYITEEYTCQFNTYFKLGLFIIASLLRVYMWLDFGIPTKLVLSHQAYSIYILLQLIATLMLYPCTVPFKPQLIDLLSIANVADHVVTTETIDPMAWGAPHKRYGPVPIPVRWYAVRPSKLAIVDTSWTHCYVFLEILKVITSLIFQNQFTYSL